MQNENTAGNGGTAVEAAHYMNLRVQPIEIMQKDMPREEFLGFLRGNVIKYALRCGHKDDPVKEMEKAAQYAAWYVEAAQGREIKPGARGRHEAEA